MSHNNPELLEDYETERMYELLSAQVEDCPACSATGEGPADGTRCPVCKGRGYYLTTKEESK